MIQDDKNNGKDNDDFGLSDFDFDSKDENKEHSLPSTPGEADIEADFGSDISDDDMEGFYKEESYDDFESPTPEPPSNRNNVDSFDNQSQGGMEDTTPYITEYPEDKKSSKGGFSKIVLIGLIIFGLIGFGCWFIYDKYFSENQRNQLISEGLRLISGEEKKDGENKTDDTSSQNDDENAIVESDSVSDSPISEEKVDLPENSPTTTAIEEEPVTTPTTSTLPVSRGEITILRSRTRDYYIIIGSFLDRDLANDYAKRLASQGESPIIIPPYGRIINTRLAITSFNSLSNAQRRLNDYRSKYGNDTWVLRY